MSYYLRPLWTPTPSSINTNQYKTEGIGQPKNGARGTCRAWLGINRAGKQIEFLVVLIKPVVTKTCEFWLPYLVKKND